MAFLPSRLATKYCVGKGIELGAGAHNPFRLPDCMNVAPCDGTNFLDPRDLADFNHCAAEQARNGGTIAPVHMVGDFQNIPVSPESLDYIVSSHVIEHEPNPIAALVECHRVLKDFGIFFCIFPKRNAETTFDIFRPLSTQEQFIEAYRQGLTPASSPLWWRGHYHVYSLQSMLALVNWANGENLTKFLIEAIEETDTKVGNGHTIILRKLPSESMKNIDYLHSIEACINGGKLAEALVTAKLSLSYDFFQPQVLYAAALLSAQAGNTEEGKNFMQQSLVSNPECEEYRREYFRLFGEHYKNPVL